MKNIIRQLKNFIQDSGKGLKQLRENQLLSSGCIEFVNNLEALLALDEINFFLQQFENNPKLSIKGGGNIGHVLFFDENFNKIQNIQIHFYKAFPKETLEPLSFLFDASKDAVEKNEAIQQLMLKLALEKYDILQLTKLFTQVLGKNARNLIEEIYARKGDLQDFIVVLIVFAKHGGKLDKDSFGGTESTEYIESLIPTKDSSLNQLNRLMTEFDGTINSYTARFFGFYKENTKSVYSAVAISTLVLFASIIIALFSQYKGGKTPQFSH